jgi:hypothetical protein
MKAALELRFIEAHHRRPPFVDLLFDAILRNHSGAPLWALIPTYLDEVKLTNAKAASAEVLSYRGRGRLIAARFNGSGGFYAILLEPGAKVVIRRLPVSSAGDPGDTVTLQSAIAKWIELEGQRAESWLPAPFAPAGSAEVEASSLVAESAKDTTGHREALVTLHGAQFFEQDVLWRKR